MINKEKLTKCPFCGCIPKIVKRSQNYYKHINFFTVSCQSSRCVANPETHACDMKGKINEKKEDAISAWNNALLKHNDNA